MGSQESHSDYDVVTKNNMALHRPDKSGRWGMEGSCSFRARSNHEAKLFTYTDHHISHGICRRVFYE